MSKFKKGDRVVIVNIEEHLKHLIGRKATIIDVDSNYEFPVELEFDEEGFNLPECFKEEELELIEQELKKSLKDDFVNKCKEVGVPTVLTVAIKLPSGAIEVITNTQDTVTKALYYTDMYDENFCLKVNTSVKVVGFMVV